jgi:hypothetical protein
VKEQLHWYTPTHDSIAQSVQRQEHSGMTRPRSSTEVRWPTSGAAQQQQQMLLHPSVRHHVSVGARLNMLLAALAHHTRANPTQHCKNAQVCTPNERRLSEAPRRPRALDSRGLHPLPGCVIALIQCGRQLVSITMLRPIPCCCCCWVEVTIRAPAGPRESRCCTCCVHHLCHMLLYCSVVPGCWVLPVCAAARGVSCGEGGHVSRTTWVGPLLQQHEQKQQQKQKHALSYHTQHTRHFQNSASRCCKRRWKWVSRWLQPCARQGQDMRPS